MRKDRDFGAPAHDGAHYWIIRIPSERGGPVELLEDYGRNGFGSGIYQPVRRALVPRANWNAVAKPLEAYLNRRLKDAGLVGGRMMTGDNTLERMIGTEACLLAWAIDDVTVAQSREAFDQMAGYTCHEIRCLHQYAKRDADILRPAYGWRKAIKFALIPSLSDAERPAQGDLL